MKLNFQNEILSTFNLPFKNIEKVIIAEKRHETILNEVEHFDQSGMHHVETAEKNPLPPLEGLFITLHPFTFSVMVLDVNLLTG